MTTARLLLAITLAAIATSAEVRADETLEWGRADFRKLCAPCHGENGKGDGPQAVHLERRPADLTIIARRNGGRFPEEQVFQTITGLDMPDSHGTREMPAWGDVFVSEDVGDSVKLEDAMKAADDASRRIAVLVSYIETLQEKP